MNASQRAEFEQIVTDLSERTAIAARAHYNQFLIAGFTITQSMDLTSEWLNEWVRMTMDKGNATAPDDDD